MQTSDNPDQLEYLSDEAQFLGYETINDLFLEEPELFDAIAAEYRSEHPVESWI